MVHRRVICDSEDEEGDFSDVDSNHSAAQNAPTTANMDGGEDERPPEDPNSDSRSTDPDFFRRIYEEQQNFPHTNIPDDRRRDDTTTQPSETRVFESSLLMSSSVKQKSSSSLTDPTTLRDSLKKTKKSKKTTGPKELANMTQVTTPDAPTSKRKDIYDFDFSDEEGASVAYNPNLKVATSEAASKKDGKRKRSAPKTPFKETDAPSSPAHVRAATHGSSANHPIELDGEDGKSPRPTRKKRKSGDQNQTTRDIPDDIDLLIIPTTGDVNDTTSGMHEANGNSGSIINDTFEALQSRSDPASASSLVIVPPSLTASQKQQYLRVSGSSELDQDHFGTDDQQQQASLPAPRDQTQGARSAHTESTIPYTTPSRYYSSAPPLYVVGEQHDHNVSDPSHEMRTQLDLAQPDCSPDELSAEPVEIMGRAKKRKSPTQNEDESAQDVAWNSDKIGFSRESYVPRPSKRRSRAVLDEEEDEAAAPPEQSMPDTCPPGVMSLEDLEQVTKTEPQVTHSVDIEGLDPDFLAAMPDDIRQEIINNHRSASDTQAARTRSRARPTETSSGPVQGQEGTPQPKKRGRKKKLPANDDMAVEADDAVAQPSPAPLASGKKKRGRPKKSGPAPVAVTDEDQPAEHESGHETGMNDELGLVESPSIEDVQVTPQTTKTKNKRGRKKKVAEEAPEVVQTHLDESTREVEAAALDDGARGQANPEPAKDDLSEDKECGGREALRDISNTVAGKTSGTADEDAETNDKDATSGSEAKNSGNTAAVSTATGQLDKVRYRVGLSKRSRIAPLLKMIRK